MSTTKKGFTATLSILIWWLAITANAEVRHAAKINARISGATNENLRPLFSYSNKWGHEAMYNQGAMAVEGTYVFSFNSKSEYRMRKCTLTDPFSLKTDSTRSLFNLEMGFTGQLSTEKERLKIYQLYASMRLAMINLQIGMQEYTPIASNSATSVGSYLMSNNARAVPQIMMGIFDWWSIPYTQDWLKIRCGLSMTVLGNEGHADYSKNVLFHQKFAYLQLGHFKFFEPYIGLVHSVMFGGTMSNGTKIPVDFWSSFTGKGGDPEKFKGEFRGEATNAAGGHQGMWDFGFNMQIASARLIVYYQKPFADGKANDLKDKSKDMTIGLRATFRSPFISSITAEFINTVWQGGNGKADPVLVDKNGELQIIYPGDIKPHEARNWAFSHIPDEYLSEYEATCEQVCDWQSLARLLRKYYNNGEEYGGRSNYLNNSYYPQGWSRNSLCMGTALFQSRKTVLAYADGNGILNYSNFPLIRLRGFNLGISGNAGKKTEYMVRYSHTKNYGNRICDYIGGSMGTEYYADNYFRSPKHQNYAELNIKYIHTPNLHFSMNLSADWGEMYSSTGLSLGATYNLSGHSRQLKHEQF